MKKQHFPYYSLIFGATTWLINLWSSTQNNFIEQYYSNGFFQIVRFLFDNTLGRLPIPAFYIFWLGVIVYWIWQIKKAPKIAILWQKASFWLLKIVGFAAIILGLFYWLWGFNYHRMPVSKTIGLSLIPLDSVALWDELKIETRICDSLRFVLIKNDTLALNDERFFPKNIEDTVRVAVENWLTRHHYPTFASVRGRVVSPQGILLGFGASGLYWPFIGEGNIDAGLHPLQKLPTMAHEMSHGYGFGDEGICNFIAFAACYQHTNPYIAYSNHLTYWRTVAANCLRSNPMRYQTTFYPYIPAGLRQDIRAIHRQMDKFEEFFPKVRYQVYDSYLKSQGIEVGMLNYDEVMMLVRALRNVNFEK
jgi:Protein of unknown function (DUF3810)